MSTLAHTKIHPTAIIGEQVTLEESVEIGPYTIITGTTHIKRNTRIGAHCTIGSPAQHTEIHSSLGSIVIGENCTIREYVSIHASMYAEGMTRIGDRCYIMNYSHVAHDVTLEHDIVLINSVNLGGHAYIEHHAVIMAIGSVHQRCRVGAYSCVTPYSGTRQDLPPFCMFVGQPGQFAGLNMLGLKRAGLTREHIHSINTVTKLFYRDKLPLDDIKSRAQQESWGTAPHVAQFLTFIADSNRGVSRGCLQYRAPSVRAPYDISEHHHEGIL